MRIVYIHQYYCNPGMSGGIRSYEQARRLVARGHEVHVVTTDITGQHLGRGWTRTDDDGIDVHWYPVPYSNHMSYARRLRAFAEFMVLATAKAIRLRAEYQFTQNFRSIHFHLTSGHDIWFGDWVDGQGFRVQGDDVVPASRPAEKPDYAALRRYLDVIFTYAGTLSVSREMRPVPLGQAQPGDVFVRGGSPGHAVTVLDVAEHPTTHARYALLAQSYMPAQDLHVLRNVAEPGLGAWFRLTAPNGAFETPEWEFSVGDLKRW